MIRRGELVWNEKKGEFSRKIQVNEISRGVKE